MVCDRTEPFGGFGAVVVTDRDGRHRFSYTGRSQQGPIFMPFGICTDAFSRIFICDGCTNSVHVIDRNGQFLSSWNHLSSIKYWNNIISLPISVGYDFNSHLLWIGSDYENKVLVIRYLDRHHNLTGMFENSLLFCHLLNSVHCFYLLIDYILVNVPLNIFRSYGGLTIPNKRQNSFSQHFQQKRIHVFIVPDLLVMVLNINNHVDVIKGFIQKYPVKCEILRNIDTHAKFIIDL